MTGSSRASDTRKAERQSVAKERRAYNGIRFTKPPSRQGKTIGIDQRHRKRGRRLQLHRVIGHEQQGPQSRQQGGGATSARNGPINGIQAELRGAYMRTSRSYVLGFITDEIATSPHAGRVLVGAQEAARKLGYILLTVNTGNDRELENEEIAALRQYRVDGFLYAMMYHRVVEIPAELEGSPTVVVDSEDENRKIPSIYPDDEMAGYDATNRLIQAGCKRIVYYGSSITIIAQGERFAGYRRALADAGIPFDEQLVVNVKRPQTPLRKPVACSTRSSRTASSASTMCARPSSTRRPRAVGRHRHRRFRDQHRQPAAHYGRAQARVDHLGASSLRNGLRSGASAGRHDRR